MPALLLQIFVVLWGPLFAVAPAAADPFQPASPTLFRRGTIGLQPGEPVESIGGVRIAGVVHDGPAYRAGLLPDDILTGIATTPTPVAEAIGEALRAHGAGQTVDIAIVREGEPMVLPITLGHRGVQLPGIHTQHGEIMTDRGYAVRTIVLSPEGKDGPGPAVMFIQGITCGSVDASTIPDRGMLKCVHDAVRAGFVALLVEKPGIGDSAGPPCDEYGFHEEMQAYRAGLTALCRHPAVDPARIVLMGYSMGGIQAPLLAAESCELGSPPVAGVVVFGTGFVPWVEYTVSNVRRQATLAGYSVDFVNSVVDAYAKFWSLLIYARLSPVEILERHPELARFGMTASEVVSAGRSVRFFTELHDSQWASAWSVIDANVLAIHGSFDYVCDERDHRWIVDVVEAAKPGRARFESIERMCHGMTVWESPEQAMRTGLGAGTPSDEDSRLIIEFINEISGSSKGE